ncbi:hypothetical protein AB0M94_00240 [Streptomyces xanthochromogenes]
MEDSEYVQILAGVYNGVLRGGWFGGIVVLVFVVFAIGLMRRRRK